VKIQGRERMENFFSFLPLFYNIHAEIAQLVEQWIEAPRVIGSNPILGIF
jgi:hypothetical protein